MNDDGIFLVIFFCTAAASGIMSSLDGSFLQAAHAVETRYCEGNQASAGVRAGLCAMANGLLDQAGANTLPDTSKSEATAIATRNP
ncbi:MAG: hypothetical protein FJ189_05365 [Gammaproteobacteria bacterium]|nr:hypothetical protein [Gammaproteobacteria bacterium]